MLSHHFPNSIAYLSDEQMFAIPPVNATSVAINRNQIYEILEEIEAMLLPSCPYDAYFEFPDPCGGVAGRLYMLLNGLTLPDFWQQFNSWSSPKQQCALGVIAHRLAIVAKMISSEDRYNLLPMPYKIVRKLEVLLRSYYIRICGPGFRFREDLDEVFFCQPTFEIRSESGVQFEAEESSEDVETLRTRIFGRSYFLVAERPSSEEGNLD